MKPNEISTAFWCGYQHYCWACSVKSNEKIFAEHVQHLFRTEMNSKEVPDFSTLISSESRLLYNWRLLSKAWRRAHSGTCDHVLLLSESCCLVSMGRPVWREDGSTICSAITQWSESRRTHNHTLLSSLRLLQPGGPGSRIHIRQEHYGPVIPPGTGFPLRRLLQLGGIRRRYSNQLPHGVNRLQGDRYIYIVMW
jgi:hypothetical protein